MNRTVQIQITELNPHLICVLCGGYYIDAATIIECLHSFCRTCIIRYLDSSKFCPICDAMVHKTKPLLHVKSDKTLQDLVYKLVPGLYKGEMKRRRDFFADFPCEGPHQPAPSEARGYEDKDRLLYTEDEQFSLSLELFSDCVPDVAIQDDSESNPDKLKKKDIRYLQCPAAVTISHLKKFLRMKFDLTHKLKIDVYYSDEPLKEYFTLMDIAYIYAWRRTAPLRLIYTVYESTGRKRKYPESQISEQITKQQKSDQMENEEEAVGDRVSPVGSENNSEKQQDENSSPLQNNDIIRTENTVIDEIEKEKTEIIEPVIKKIPTKNKLHEKGTVKNILNGKCTSKINRNGNLFPSNLISRQSYDKELLNGKEGPLDMTKKTLKESKKMHGNTIIKSKTQSSNGVNGSLFPDFEFTD